MSTENSNVAAPLAPANTQVAAPLVPAIDVTKQLNIFTDAFQLEGEKVGTSVRKKVSLKTGQVRVDLMTRKDITAALNIKGEALDIHMRDKAMALKSEMAAGFSRLASNPNWVGQAIVMKGDGEAITFHLKKVKPLVLSTPKAAELDEAAMLKKLGVDPVKFAMMKADMAIKPEEKPEEKPADVSGTGPGEPASNGAAQVE